MLNHLTATHESIYTRENTRVSRGIDDPVGVRQGFEIAARADIRMHDLDAARQQRCPIQVASWSAEIVNPGNSQSRLLVQEGVGEAAADESADA